MLIRFFSTTSLLLAALLVSGSLTQGQGRLARVVSTIIHEDESQTLSNRDFIKRTMEQQTFSPRGILQMKRIFQMDRVGKVRSGLAFDGQSKPLLKFSYAYDELDRLKTEEVRDMKDNIIRVMETVYDEQGKAHRIAKTEENLAAIQQHHRQILEHPESLENSGRKVDGNQLDFDRDKK